jgi:hypothetical protein
MIVLLMLDPRAYPERRNKDCKFDLKRGILLRVRAGWFASVRYKTERNDLVKRSAARESVDICNKRVIPFRSQENRIRSR